MPEVYIHLSGAEFDQKLLENAGLIEDDPDPADKALEPRFCSRCKTMESKWWTLLYQVLYGTQ